MTRLREPGDGASASVSACAVNFGCTVYNVYNVMLIRGRSRLLLLCTCSCMNTYLHLHVYLCFCTCLCLCAAHVCSLSALRTWALGFKRRRLAKSWASTRRVESLRFGLAPLVVASESNGCVSFQKCPREITHFGGSVCVLL